MNKTHTVAKKHDNLFEVSNVILNYQHRTMQSQRSNSQRKKICFAFYQKCIANTPITLKMRCTAENIHLIRYIDIHAYIHNRITKRLKYSP